MQLGDSNTHLQRANSQSTGHINLGFRAQRSAVESTPRAFGAVEPRRDDCSAAARRAAGCILQATWLQAYACKATSGGSAAGAAPAPCATTTAQVRARTFTLPMLASDLLTAEAFWARKSRLCRLCLHCSMQRLLFSLESLLARSGQSQSCALQAFRPAQRA